LAQRFYKLATTWKNPTCAAQPLPAKRISLCGKD
jgi:hypothetical protein